MCGRLRDVELPVALCATAAVGSAFLFAHTGIPAWIPPALITRFGIPSPFSGMTRSAVALARGDLAGSFAWHPLGPFALATLAGAAAVCWYSLATGRRVDPVARALSSRALWALVVAAIVVVWVRQIVALPV